MKTEKSGGHQTRLFKHERDKINNEETGPEGFAKESDVGSTADKENLMDTQCETKHHLELMKLSEGTLTSAVGASTPDEASEELLAANNPEPESLGDTTGTDDPVETEDNITAVEHPVNPTDQVKITPEQKSIVNKQQVEYANNCTHLELDMREPKDPVSFSVNQSPISPDLSLSDFTSQADLPSLSDWSSPLTPTIHADNSGDGEYLRYSGGGENSEDIFPFEPAAAAEKDWRPSRYSSHLGVEEYPRRRAKSPVTVQEWVASLPDIPADTDSPATADTGSVNADLDNLRLGAEAGHIQTHSIQTHNAAKMIFRNGQLRTKEKRNLFLHSDTNASLNSEQSNLSLSSVDSLLQSREPDPEEILLSLGFGGVSSPLSRIPARFFRTKSQARGIDIHTFLKHEEELDERFQSGYCGYRGLVGSSSRRPSEIVEKIIETLREREREVRRKNSNQSWAASTAPTYSPNIPARFKIMDPNRPTFESIVEQITMTSKPAGKSFKSIAKSVLSPENREWRQDEASRTQERRRRIHMAGKSFLIDDEGHEVAEEQEEAEEEEEEEESVEPEDAEVSRGSPRSKLEHQDSLMSINSTISVESDWSDEEREELEKMFGVMSEKGEEYTKLRQLRRMRRRSRQKVSSRMSSSTGGTPSNASWDGARLVYSRESSLSEITASSLDMERPGSGLTSYREEEQETDLHLYHKEKETGPVS